MENYNSTISIGSREITNLHFDDEIDGCARKTNYQNSCKNLDTAATKFGIGVNAETQR